MDWLIEAAKQVPALSVLVWVVNRFLGYMKTRDAVIADSLKEISGQCHEQQREATAATRDVVAALGEVRVTMARLNGRAP